jgi:DNA-binding response OmpR family regulator/S1-C subfamily serine protease
VTSAPERVFIIEGDPVSRNSLLELLGTAGYEVSGTSSPEEGFAVVRNLGCDLLLLDANLSDLDCCQVLKEIKGSSAIEAIRVILLSAGGVGERSRGLDLGADDVLSRPWEPAELLARVRVQLRVKRALDQWREKTQVAEQGQEIAHSAFQALGVTEKMSRDAFSLGRMLKVGVAAFFVIAAVAVGILIISSRRVEKETKRAYAVITQLERGVAKQQDLVAQSRKIREEIEQSTTAAPEQKQEFDKHSKELRGKAAEDSGDLAALRQQLAETTNRLRRIEEESRVAEGIIRSYAQSICLLHVVLTFRDKISGQRLRYAGINPQGEPLQDSEGNPIFSLSGPGPEVTAHFFGTGFIAAADARILTNRHVVEPWWKSNELNLILHQGIEPVIAEIGAYFPDSPRAFRVEIHKVSPDADLAVVRGNLADLKRPMLPLDDGKVAAVSGQPVVSVGYATALAGILARAGDETAETIVTATNGNLSEVLAELARRNLIRPVTTQGHIGDVLIDKIVYDAQTTSGGSGEPLFNHHGRVIGVTFAVVKGFSGSNFGIPIRYATPLLTR